MRNHVIVITNRKKLIISIIAITFIIAASVIITNINFPKTKPAFNIKVVDAMTPQKENKYLKDILTSIIPSTANILFEDGSRNIGNPYQSDNIGVPVSEVFKNGNSVPYKTVYLNEDYLRPIYDASWKDAYFRGWLYLPRKIISARHTLFTYHGGASNIFDIEGELGFYPNISIDNINDINFLIYNCSIDTVNIYNQQIVISGRTTKKGAEIIAVDLDKTALDRSKDLFVQLCTPNGYELDYQKVRLNDNYEDYGPVQDSFSSSETADDSKLTKENKLLDEELTHFISNSGKSVYFQYNGSYQTSNVLNTNIDLEDALKYMTPINYTSLYNNKNFRCPVFHPEWREHYDREWCYIPRKMYINMKRIFVLPENKEVTNDLCGELGFFDKFPAAEKNQVAFMVNNFIVQSIGIYDDNILVTGVPSRTGMHVITIPKNKLIKNTEYALRLVTKDECEIDVDVIKN